jgi:BirA family biotin operon repressor/biotin-[acetyl-CoA-carboxylase] ligase
LFTPALTDMDKPMNILKVKEINSTHSYVLEDVEGEDILVVAERQTKGVTSKPDQEWHSELGGLFLSLRVTRRGLMKARKIAVKELGIELSTLFSKMFGIDIQFQDPNDLYVKDKKIGGILVERNNLTTIYSLGLNINQKAFPAELKNIATSVVLETSKENNLDSILDEVVTYFNAKIIYYEEKLPHYVKPLLTRAYKRRKK